MREDSEGTSQCWEPDGFLPAQSQRSTSTTRCSSFFCHCSHPLPDQTRLNFPFCSVSWGFHVLCSRRLLPMCYSAQIEACPAETATTSPEHFLHWSKPGQSTPPVTYLWVLQHNCIARLSSSCFHAPCMAQHSTSPWLLMLCIRPSHTVCEEWEQLIAQSTD